MLNVEKGAQDEAKISIIIACTVCMFTQLRTEKANNYFLHQAKTTSVSLNELFMHKEIIVKQYNYGQHNPIFLFTSVTLANKTSTV